MSLPVALQLQLGGISHRVVQLVGKSWDLSDAALPCIAALHNPCSASHLLLTVLREGKSGCFELRQPLKRGDWGVELCSSQYFFTHEALKWDFFISVELHSQQLQKHTNTHILQSKANSVFVGESSAVGEILSLPQISTCGVGYNVVLSINQSNIGAALKHLKFVYLVSLISVYVWVKQNTNLRDHSIFEIRIKLSDIFIKLFVDHRIPI